MQQQAEASGSRRLKNIKKCLSPEKKIENFFWLELQLAAACFSLMQLDAACCSSNLQNIKKCLSPEKKIENFFWLELQLAAACFSLMQLDAACCSSKLHQDAKYQKNV
jgi:hypothetical protein